MLLSLARAVSESARSVSGISIAVSQVHSCHRPTDSKINDRPARKKIAAQQQTLTFYAPWNIPPNISPSSPLTFHHISLWHLSIFSFGIHLYFTLTSHHIFLWHPSVFFSGIPPYFSLTPLHILLWHPSIFYAGFQPYFPLASIYILRWHPIKPLWHPSTSASDAHPNFTQNSHRFPPGHPFKIHLNSLPIFTLTS